MNNGFFKVMIVVIAVVASLMIGYSWGNNEKNKKSNEELSKEPEYHSYVIGEISKNDNPEVKNIRFVYAFDKSNKCVECRQCWEFSDEITALDNYNNWKNIVSNLEIEGTKVSFNDNTENYIVGKSKEKIMSNEQFTFIEL